MLMWVVQKLLAKLDELNTKLDGKEKELEKERDLETLYSDRAKESAGMLQKLLGIIVRHCIDVAHG